MHFENRCRHADGSYRLLLWNATPMVEERMLYAAAIDITEREHADEMFRNLLHAAPDSIIITDLRGNILRVNRATERLFGYASNELVGQSIDVLVPPRFRDKHRKNRNVHAANPRPRSIEDGLDMFGVRKDGSEFSAQISLGPVKSREGRIVICAARDVSLQKQREHDLQENQRRLQALAARSSWPRKASAGESPAGFMTMSVRRCWRRS